MPKTLSERERRFVLAYTGEALGNATEAAKIAGYAPKSAGKAGWELTKRPHVQQALEQRQQKLTHTIDLRDERILEEIGKVAFADVEVKKAGDKVKALELLAKHKRLIDGDNQGSAKVTVNIGFLGSGPQVIDVTPRQDE